MKLTMRSGEVGKRIALCKKCSNLNKMSFCKLCGCFMPAKVRIPSASCPILLWDKHDPNAPKDLIPVKAIEEQ